tara:strand:- start:18497 stop:18718 length:222 start_codon:yes stop_codon:yes gene_type:complete
MPKKIWKKTNNVMVVGDGCRICGKEITNDMSFLAFANKTHAHLSCDRQEYYKKLANQQKKDNDKKRLSQNEIR